MILFAIVTTQRTGSTWLVDLLDSHPGIRCYSELFLERGEGVPAWGGAKDLMFWDAFRERTGPDLGAYLDRIARRDGDVRAAGFKLMYGQAGAHPDLLPTLAVRGGRVVHLVRANLLDVHVSRMVAWSRDLYRSAGGTVPAPASVRLDASTLEADLDRMLAERRRAVERLASLGLDTHEVHYEDLVAGPAAIEQVVRFLGVEPTALGSPLQKLVRRPREPGDQQRRRGQGGADGHAPRMDAAAGAGLRVMRSCQRGSGP